MKLVPEEAYNAGFETKVGFRSALCGTNDIVYSQH
jgi:hypothetical protein